MRNPWESDTYRGNPDDALDATPRLPDSGELYAPAAHELTRDAMIADTIRRVRECLADQQAAMTGGAVEPPAWGFALAPGDYQVCGSCGACGVALEVQAGPEDPSSGQCHHPSGYRTSRPCWLLVTLDGSVVPLSEQLLAALRPTWDRRARVIYAQGQVLAAIEAGSASHATSPSGASWRPSCWPPAAARSDVRPVSGLARSSPATLGTRSSTPPRPSPQAGRGSRAASTPGWAPVGSHPVALELSPTQALDIPWAAPITTHVVAPDRRHLARLHCELRQVAYPEATTDGLVFLTTSRPAFLPA
jgi:hypothetical protein